MAVGPQQKRPIPPPPDNVPAQMQRSRGFLQEVWAELKKVTWPTWPEAYRLTMVVLAVIVVIGIYVGVTDFVLSKVFNVLIKSK